MIITLDILDSEKDRVLDAFSEVLPYNLDSTLIPGTDESTKTICLNDALKNFVRSVVLLKEGPPPSEQSLTDMKTNSDVF